MSVSSGPPELPPDSPGSSVSSRLQNEYTDLVRRAVILNNHGQTTSVTLNPLVLGTKQQKMSKKHEPVNDLIDLNNCDTPRTDRSRSEAEIRRDQLSQIPTLNQLLSTGVFTSNEQATNNSQISLKDTDDPIVRHLVRYSELVSNELESKPITEKMDHWYLDLKMNLMNEFEKLRLEFLEEAQQEALREKQAQAKEYIRLNQDIKTMREMLTHYEHTIDEKDRTEKSLNKALDHLYNKTIIYRRYYEWRLVHIEQQRHQYSFSLAKRFHDDKIKRKALNQWKSMTEIEWKKRFEKACEKKAKDVLGELGNEYELKYKQMELQLFNANEEIARLKADRGEQDEALKKAFMRGVCALNMEAMSVLLKNPHESDTMPFVTDEQRSEQDAPSSDEATPWRNSSSTTGDDELIRSAPSSHRHTLPTHVYKESLPSTIYRTGEARPARKFHNTHRTRQVTFEKRPSTGVNRPRVSNANVFVERHAPSNRIYS